MSTQATPREDLKNSWAIAGILLLAFGTLWTVFQTQFTNLEKAISDQKRESVLTAERLAAELSRRELEIKDQINHLRGELVPKTELDGRQAVIDREIERMVTASSFQEFEQRFTDALRRLDQIENSRPTTDTLNSTIRSLEKRIDVLEGPKVHGGLL